MQYCEKCRRVCEEGAAKCPNCHSQKLRPAGEGDMAFLCGCDLYAAQRLSETLEAAGIPHRMENAGNAHAYFSFDSSSMPTDQHIYVAFGQMEQAKELSAQVARQLEQERGESGQDAEPPTAKRIIGEVLSVVAFLALIMLAVYGADGLANWLKSILH